MELCRLIGLRSRRAAEEGQTDSAPAGDLAGRAALAVVLVIPRRGSGVAVGFTGVLLMLRPDQATIGLETLMPLAAGALYGLGK